MMGKLPRRDLWLLPLLSALTLLVLLMGSEALTRAIWPEQIVNSCRIPDPIFKFRYRPDCTTTMKAAEGPWHTATYNDCGYRSDTSCGPVPAGTRRIALLGASVAEGYMVEFPNTIGARLATDLTAMCDTPVDVQNLGAIGYFGNRLVPRMAEAVKLHPDLAILIVAPLDVEAIENPDPAPVTVSTPAPVERGDLQKRLFETVKESRAFVVAQHFMFRNPALYVPLYLQYGDKADFLRSPFTVPWQTRLQWLDVLVGKLQAEASAAGVPFMIAFIPQEAQVALMAGRYQSSAMQAEALPNAIGAIARKLARCSRIHPSRCGLSQSPNSYSTKWTATCPVRGNRSQPPISPRTYRARSAIALPHVIVPHSRTGITS